MPPWRVRPLRRAPHCSSQEAVLNAEMSAKECKRKSAKVVIFFSLTEGLAPLPDPTPTPPRPHPDPTQHPEKDPKRTRNRPQTEPNGAKWSRREPNGAEMDRNRAFRGGTGGGFVGVGGVGGCKGKRKSLRKRVMMEKGEQFISI